MSRKILQVKLMYGCQQVLISPDKDLKSSPTIGQGIMGGLKQIVGGNNETYANICEVARQEAYDRMVQHAQSIGANAVICMRYDATEFSDSVTEVLAYGTAVKIEP
jgi:uncharacterized protein YbjQ (UPF0145 family)